MELKEFIAEQKALLDDFEADYERRRKKKSLTLFRRPSEWDELYGEYKEIYQERDADSRTTTDRAA